MRHHLTRIGLVFALLAPQHIGLLLPAFTEPDDMDVDEFQFRDEWEDDDEEQFETEDWDHLDRKNWPRQNHIEIEA